MLFKKIGVVCASGIGDALIMQMVGHYLQTQGCEVVTFSDHLNSFGAWLKGYSFDHQPSLDQIEQVFQSFDALFLQHDNSLKAYAIKKLPIPIYTFYGSFKPSKHGCFRAEWDFLCDPKKTMVDNTAAAMNQFFGGFSTENGLRAPEGLLHRRFKNRIAIHPTSNSKRKNWPKTKFHALAADLRKKGLDPVFTTAPHEADEWEGPLFPTLEDLASFIYESRAFIGNDSGTGHLASYLEIPHLIIGADPLHFQLWQPGWRKGRIVTPPPYLPKWKIIKNNWKTFVTKRNIIKNFNYI